MQEDTIIQKNLFAIDNENIEQKEIAKIPEDLSVDDLKKESQNRPRQRKNTTNFINKFKTDSISHNKNVCINEESYSYKTVSKMKLTPVMKHYVTLKEENKERLLLYRLGDFFECFFEDAVLISNLLEITLTSKDAGKRLVRSLWQEFPIMQWRDTVLI